MSVFELNEKHTKDRARQAFYQQKKKEEKAKKQCCFTFKSQNI